MKRVPGMVGIRERLREFHEDESGESGAMSNVMFLAIAAFVVVVLAAYGDEGLKKLKEWMNLIFNRNPPQPVP